MVVTDVVEPLHRTSWMTPAQCLAFYKVPYKVREIQIHWWDDPKKKPTHAGIVDYIRNKKEGSVNYVVSAGRVTSMVVEDNCAVTTQNGNPHGIKLECSPYGTDADYKMIGKLVADIQKRRGRLPLVPHKKYWNTTCPGTLDLGWIQAEADKFMEEDMTDKQAAAISKWARLLQHLSEKDAAAYAKPDVPYLKENGIDGVAKLLEGIYRDKVWQDANYKAVNYDKNADTDAAKKLQQIKDALK